jgi:hypothetical protein
LRQTVFGRGWAATGAGFRKEIYVGPRTLVRIADYNRPVNTIKKNSPVPALAVAALITAAVIGGGWALSGEMRLQSEWMFPALLAGFVLFSGRPRWVKNAPGPITQSAFAPHRS